jgi:2,4-diaminopentanoate dehydrogenase
MPRQQPVRRVTLAEHLGITLDDVRQRSERWFTQEPIDCVMTKVEPGGMAAVGFAVEGVRDGEPVITLEHVTRLTSAAAPDWEFPPEGHTGVHRVVVEGEPRVEINTHVSHPLFDSTDSGCISTAARAMNAIDWICRAPKGLISVADIPQSATLRGLMWSDPQRN